MKCVRWKGHWGARENEREREREEEDREEEGSSSMKDAEQKLMSSGQKVTEAERAEGEKERKEHQGTEDDVSVKRKITSAPRAFTWLC